MMMILNHQEYPREILPVLYGDITAQCLLEVGLRSVIFSETVTIYCKEENVLFNDAINTFYLRSYGVGHMVKDHAGSTRGNPLPPLHELLFPISSKGSLICTIPQT